MASTMAKFGKTSTAMTRCPRMSATVIVVLLLTACSSTSLTRSDTLSFQQLLTEIGSSPDAGLSKIRRMIPNENTRVLTPNVIQPAPFTTSDGYVVERMTINLDRQQAARTYSFYVRQGNCMPLTAVPGFERAERRTKPPSHPIVRGSYADWLILLPGAVLSLIPQAHDENCIAHVSARRR